MVTLFIQKTSLMALIQVRTLSNQQCSFITPQNILLCAIKISQRSSPVWSLQWIHKGGTSSASGWLPLHFSPTECSLSYSAPVTQGVAAHSPLLKASMGRILQGVTLISICNETCQGTSWVQQPDGEPAGWPAALSPVLLMDSEVQHTVGEATVGMLVCTVVCKLKGCAKLSS